MISEEQLIAWEAELVERNRFHWYGEVKLLIDEIWRLKTAYENEVIKSVKLKHEADWLAWQCETLSSHNPVLRQGMSKKQWREAAREAVQNVDD